MIPSGSSSCALLDHFVSFYFPLYLFHCRVFKTSSTMSKWRSLDSTGSEGHLREDDLLKRTGGPRLRPSFDGFSGPISARPLWQIWQLSLKVRRSLKLICHFWVIDKSPELLWTHFVEGPAFRLVSPQQTGVLSALLTKLSIERWEVSCWF